MRRLIVVTLTAIILATSGIALACSCPSWASAAEHSAHADIIFRGRAIQTRPEAGIVDGGAVTTFELIAPLKMPTEWEEVVPHRIEVRHDTTGGGMCGVVYTDGAETLIIANIGVDRRLHTNACNAPRWPESEYRRALRLAD
jgi:hypothetical protein